MSEGQCAFPVIARSKAPKQSSLSSRDEMDCFARARNDEFQALSLRPYQRTHPMQYRNLGRSGLKVSPICLGTMMFGGPTDEATSMRIVAKAREAGVNFIDSADAYNGGNSEQVVGRAISNYRHNWVLATKLANPMGDDPNRGGLSRRWGLQAADESLKRLGTDYIDIYYLHKEDHSTPLAETVRAMGELIQAGK